MTNQTISLSKLSSKVHLVIRRAVIASVCITTIVTSSCKKEDKSDSPDTVTSEQVITDFANVLVNPNYRDIESKAGTLNDAVLNLNSNTTDDNLKIAQNAWRETRKSWEQAEGYLFGPVEDYNYDPTMDTWPVDKTSMDSLLNSSNPLALSDIDAARESLKGFHPLEYMLWGTGGKKKAADFTDREKLYMVSLALNLYNTTIALRKSWDVNHGDFTSEFVNAGATSLSFATRKDALIAVVTAMAGICEEVANGKMEEPLINQDSTLEESQFAHNSTTDFQNNMVGVQNAYMGKYFTEGIGLNDIVSAKNISLDNKLKNQINAAINSFNYINSNYGAAIYTQQVQIRKSQEAINNLKNTLENDLMNFIHANITD